MTFVKITPKPSSTYKEYFKISKVCDVNSLHSTEIDVAELFSKDLVGAVT